MRNKLITGVVLLATTLLTTTACNIDTSSTAGTHADKVVAQEKKDKKTEKTKAPDPGPSYTKAQEQAIGTANDYLDYSSFSRSGLINQLKFEHYSLADATFAVNHIKVDWNVQAAGSAKDYLDQEHFSRQGLIDQLKFEGFTLAQATYGVNHAGL